MNAKILIRRGLWLFRRPSRPCRTKPIVRLRISDRGLRTALRRDACPVVFHLGAARAGCTNKPNFRRDRVGRSLGDRGRGLLYKQSQFPASRRLGPAHRVKQSQFPATWVARGSVVQTNPIGRSQSCETNPIRGGAGWGEGRDVEQTNPICRGRAGRAIAKAFGLDAATRAGANRAKQTQFRREFQV
jgi:hypothetical protein